MFFSPGGALARPGTGLSRVCSRVHHAENPMFMGLVTGVTGKTPPGYPHAISHRRYRPPFEHPTLHHSSTPFHVLNRSSRRLPSLGRPFKPSEPFRSHPNLSEAIRTFPKPSETIRGHPNPSEVDIFFSPPGFSSPPLSVSSVCSC
jgi:hypothetical protein